VPQCARVGQPSQSFCSPSSKSNEKHRRQPVTGASGATSFRLLSQQMPFHYTPKASLRIGVTIIWFGFMFYGENSEVTLDAFALDQPHHDQDDGDEEEQVDEPAHGEIGYEPEQPGDNQDDGERI
jgi:hypothetical protein